MDDATPLQIEIHRWLFAMQGASNINEYYLEEDFKRFLQRL